MSQEGSILDSLQNSMPGVAVRMALEKAVASLIAHDAVTARNLRALDGKILQVQVSAPALNLFVRFGEKPALLGSYEQEPDCLVSGPAVSLARLALTDDPMASLQQNNMTLSGDSSLLEAASVIVREADIDWEGLLSQYTGGVVAHLVGSVFRQGRNTVKDSCDTLLANLPEILQEELRLLPPSGQTEAFREDLDELHLATDRLQARVERLSSQPIGGY
ncbi:ubiquinone biosynthesis accessory factor UbiJ [Sansalvadorimonas verongulae]|uniref:ubiquinone biosynthesis accessory factor UbiJ n=1 Tax=Sansalvadorimonas verongulae TaxID=2172824 RepID=UPI0012BC59E7|nr:SCP2 sterol-binding domain-containing protein [Sansalvadorimonas verongulae]MTI15490.1 hypothetical protein [Sansalvadorimonas verongulae]